MPEGDTIHRIAVSLGPRLVGKLLERVTTQGLARQIAGATVTAVSAHGKHLVIDVDTGAYLRMHLGMYGRQRSYPRGEGEAMLAKMSPGRVSLALVTADDVHLWIGARTVEISDRRAPRHGDAISALGPDVLADDFDSRLVASRAALHAMRGRIDLDELEALYTAARELMQANLGPAGARDPYAVYSRTGKPCPRCAGAISCYRLGDPPRWTWSCPDCQPQCGVSS